MDIIRIIQVYGIYSFIAILFLALGVKIYWRNKTNRINQMISWCFFTIGAGLLINLVYAPLTDPGPVIVMNILTNYLACFGLVFLLVGALVIYRSNAAVSDKQKLAIILCYAMVLAGLFFIPDGPRVNVDATISWSLPFTTYGLVASQVVFTATVLFSILAYRDFGDLAIKMKFRQFMLGIVLLDYILVQNYLINAGIIPRNLILTMVSPVVIPTAILLYNGIGKHT